MRRMIHVSSGQYVKDELEDGNEDRDTLDNAGNMSACAGHVSSADSET